MNIVIPLAMWYHDFMSQYSAEYYLKNRDKMLAYSKKWQAENPEMVREIQRKSYLKVGKKYQKRWAKENADLIKKHKKVYREKHKTEPKYWISERISGWKSKLLNIPSNLTTKYLVDLYNQQKGKCYFTGENIYFSPARNKVAHNSASLDRLIPAKGYVRGNVVWCSFFVNTMKGKLDEQSFYDLIKKIVRYKCK